MPITKSNSIISYTEKADRWDSDTTGVFAASDIAIADDSDPTKQLKFVTSGIAADTTVSLTAPAASGIIGLAGNARIQYSAPLTGASVALASTTDILIIEPAGTIAELTITLPAAVDGKVIALSSTQIVSSLTLTANGSDSVVTGLSALAVGIALRLVARSTKWYRC